MLGLTIMIHCLFKSSEAFFEHLGVNINHIYSCFPVVMFFSRVIENAKRNVTSPSCYIDALHRCLPAWSQCWHERVFPQPVNAKGRCIVHKIIFRGNRIENIFNQGFFRILWDSFETKWCRPTMKVGRRSRRRYLWVVEPYWSRWASL